MPLRKCGLRQFSEENDYLYAEYEIFKPASYVVETDCRR